MHSCKNCGYSTNRKYNYDRHIQKCLLQDESSNKKEINNESKTDIINNFSSRENRNICVYCDKIFSRKDTLIRHINYYCKDKTEEHKKNKLSSNTEKNSSVKSKQRNPKKTNKINILEDTINQQHDMIENLSKILEKAVDKVTTNDIDINGNNTDIIYSSDSKEPTHIINNIQNQQNNFYQKKQVNNTLNQTYNNNQQNNFYSNIYINDYGKEDLSYITKDMLKQLIQQPNKSIEEFTRMVHFHQNHPENVNVLIFSKRSNEIAVFRDGRWHLKKKDNFLDGFIGDKFDQLYDIFDVHKDQIDNEKIEKFEKYADKFGRINGKERDIATDDVKNLISSESYYYSGHYQKTKKQIQRELFEKTGKVIPTSNIIKKKRPDEDTIGYIEGSPFELMENDDGVETHIHRIKDI